ncbi:hypothetical protein [Janibacter sp. Soil728]|uniref:hypothetical protein n=1 Tax=Janibacter sp. Soil728 TaxID=1736393 RepID=UPI0012E89DFD|nr:hypothetical protein [Janibacter sp. Soil728]
MTWDDLQEDEIEVDEPSELLWRNCAESWVDDGVPSKQLFLPTKKDNKQLSTARSSVVNADQHFTEFCATGSQSTGIWAVSVDELQSAQLRAVDDSKAGFSPLTGHCFVDFRQCSSGGVIQRAARALKDHALARGQQHP